MIFKSGQDTDEHFFGSSESTSALCDGTASFQGVHSYNLPSFKLGSSSLSTVFLQEF